MSLINYNIRDNKYYNTLISRLIVLGIDNYLGFLLVFYYTTILSRIITISKLLILYQAFYKKKNNIFKLAKE